VMWQASKPGRQREPLKHRKRGEYRDVPVPSWLWTMVKDLPGGPLMPGLSGKTFQQYGMIYFWFTRAAEVAGIPDGFTSHSLRHAFASAMLARGVQITELAHFLGASGHQRHASGLWTPAAVCGQENRGSAGR
jgi:integrase